MNEPIDDLIIEIDILDVLMYDRDKEYKLSYLNYHVYVFWTIRRYLNSTLFDYE